MVILMPEIIFSWNLLAQFSTTNTAVIIRSDCFIQMFVSRERRYNVAKAFLVNILSSLKSWLVEELSWLQLRRWRIRRWWWSSTWTYPTRSYPKAASGCFRLGFCSTSGPKQAESWQSGSTRKCTSASRASCSPQHQGSFDWILRFHRLACRKVPIFFQGLADVHQSLVNFAAVAVKHVALEWTDFSEVS